MSSNKFLPCFLTSCCCFLLWSLSLLQLGDVTAFSAFCHQGNCHATSTATKKYNVAFASPSLSSPCAYCTSTTIKRGNTLLFQNLDNNDDEGEEEDLTFAYNSNKQNEATTTTTTKTVWKESQQSMIQTSSDKSKYWILLVDDDPDIRLAVGNFLSQESGYRVTTCESAPEALKLLLPSSLDDKENDSRPQPNSPLLPNVVISDVRMPFMDGIQMLQTLRSNPRTVALPVLLLTAKGNIQDRINGYNAGADAYLPKPFDPQELLSILQMLLQKQEMLTLPHVQVEDLQRDLREIKHWLLLDRGQQDNAVFLAPDEQQILELVCQGKTNREIASLCYLSTRRIGQLLTRLFQKANVSNRTELLRWAIATGHVRL